MNAGFDADYVCPLPPTWALIHQRLVAHWEHDTRGLPEPPVPLILAAWNFTSDQEKAESWAATRRWAAAYGCDPSVIGVADGEKYRG